MDGAGRIRELGGTTFEGFDYWHRGDGERAVLADLAQLLLAEEVIVIPNWDIGVTALDDAFGPALATKLVKTKRIVLPIDVTGTWSRKVYDRIHYRIRGWFPGEKPKPNDDDAARKAFHEAVLEYAVREIHEVDVQAVEARTNGIFTTWQHEFGTQGIAQVANYLHGLPNLMRITDLPQDEACLEIARRIARLLALGWSCGAVKSWLASDTTRFLQSLSHRPRKSTAASAIDKLLTYNNLPDVKSLVLNETWGPAEVVAAVTGPGSARLREWLRQHAQSGGGDVVAAYKKSERDLPRLTLWRKSLRYGSTTALSLGLSTLLGDSALAATLVVPRLVGGTPLHGREDVNQPRTIPTRDARSGSPMKAALPPNRTRRSPASGSPVGVSPRD